MACGQCSCGDGRRQDDDALEASGLIDELFEKYGGNNGNQRRRFNGRAASPR